MEILSYSVILLTIVGIYNIFNTLTNYSTSLKIVASSTSTIIFLNLANVIFLLFGMMTVITIIYLLYRTISRFSEVKKKGVTAIFN